LFVGCVGNADLNDWEIPREEEIDQNVESEKRDVARIEGRSSKGLHERFDEAIRRERVSFHWD
jgi:hypothetical protein